MPKKTNSENAPQLVGAKLRERRRHLNLTLQEVADRVGVTKGFLSEIERDRAAPSVATLLKLRDALSLSVSTLFHSAIPQVVRQQARVPIPYGGIGMSCSVVAGCMKTASVFDDLPFGMKRMPSQFTMPCEPAKP